MGQKVGSWVRRLAHDVILTPSYPGFEQMLVFDVMRALIMHGGAF